MKFFLQPAGWRTLVWLLLAPMYPAYGFHGIWLPAFGADQAGLAGAFYSAYGSPLVLEENPALLGRIKGHSFQVSLAVNRARIDYRDRYYDPATGTFYSNQREFKPIAPLPALGYGYGGDRWAFGVAVYVQGGGGADFQNLLRPYTETEVKAERPGTDVLEGQNNLALENVQARFALLKLTPGLSYRWGSLTLGLALDMVHAKKKLDRHYTRLDGLVLLPGGIHYRSDPAYALGAKAGLSWEDGPLAIAVSFISSSRFYLDGRLRTDTYDIQQAGNASVSRYMEWPARFVAGMEYRMGEYRLVFDVSHTLWSHSMHSLLFTLDETKVLTPLGSRSPYLRMNLLWKDQTVISLGLQRTLDDLVLRAGYSYGPTVQTEQGVNPLLGTTVEHHITMGLGWMIGESGTPSSFDVALQYSLPHTVRGAPLSDWWLGHAVQTEPLRAAFFEYEKTTEVLTLYLGLTLRWE